MRTWFTLLGAYDFAARVCGGLIRKLQPSSDSTAHSRVSNDAQSRQPSPSCDFSASHRIVVCNSASVVLSIPSLLLRYLLTDCPMRLISATAAFGAIICSCTPPVSG